MATAEELSAMTKAELYDLATEADIEGRSGMSKGELVDALLELEGEEEPVKVDAGFAGSSHEPSPNPPQEKVDAVQQVYESLTAAAALVEQLQPLTGSRWPALKIIAGQLRAEAHRTGRRARR